MRLTKIFSPPKITAAVLSLFMSDLSTAAPIYETYAPEFNGRNMYEHNSLMNNNRPYQENLAFGFGLIDAEKVILAGQPSW